MLEPPQAESKEVQMRLFPEEEFSKLGICLEQKPKQNGRRTEACYYDLRDGV
jgi:hypothetical protein